VTSLPQTESPGSRAAHIPEQSSLHPQQTEQTPPRRVVGFEYTSGCGRVAHEPIHQFEIYRQTAVLEYRWQAIYCEILY